MAIAIAAWKTMSSTVNDVPLGITALRIKLRAGPNQASSAKLP